MPRYHATPNGLVQFTAEEEAKKDAEAKAAIDNKSSNQIAEIRKIRNEKLQETDYLANSDVTMPDNIKTWRQSLRDLPQNNTTETEYDALLARDSDGNLTNSIWSNP